MTDKKKLRDRSELIMRDLHMIFSDFYVNYPVPEAFFLVLFLFKEGKLSYYKRSATSSIMFYRYEGDDEVLSDKIYSTYREFGFESNEFKSLVENTSHQHKAIYADVDESIGDVYLIIYKQLQLMDSTANTIKIYDKQIFAVDLFYRLATLCHYRWMDGDLDAAEDVCVVYENARRWINDNFERFLDIFVNHNPDADLQDEPIGLSRLLSALLEYKSGKVLHNYAGTARVGADLNIGDNYYAVEDNALFWAMGKLRLISKGITSKNFICNISDRMQYCNEFSLIITSPPCDIQSNKSRVLNYPFHIESNLDNLSSDGRMIALLPVYTLSQLREIDSIETIILLPKKLLYHTAIQLAIVIFSKSKVVDQIKMVDGSSFFMESASRNILKTDDLLLSINGLDSKYVKLVSKEEVVLNNSSLTPSVYLIDPLNGRKMPDGFELKKLKELVSPYRGKSESSGEIRLVRGKDLAEKRFSFDKTFEDLQPEVTNQKFSILDKDLLLLLRIGKLKPTYFHYSAYFEIGCNPNILAFEFKSDVINPQYLINELGKDYVNQQVAVRSNAAVMPSISSKDILEIEVLVPIDFDTQKIVFENDKYNHSLLKASELGLEGIVAQMKSDYLAVVEDRQHDTRKYLRNLRHSNMSIKSYLKKSATGIDPDIADLLHSQEQAIITLSEMIGTLANEEQFGIAEKVNLDKFFTDLEVNHSSKARFDIVYDKDVEALIECGLMNHELISTIPSSDIIAELKSSPMDYDNLIVNIATLDLYRLVSNIISNAEMHSFTDNDREDYELRIDLSADKERKMFQIDFRNNGMPFPLGLTKEFYGRRGKGAGKTKNTGNGGYIVKSICEHFGGDYDIYCDPLSNMPVTVRIYLPIVRDDE